jgi:antitoxin (DNA-binding transcriptional repressor) of toxin-antitoxin stability system
VVSKIIDLDQETNSLDMLLDQLKLNDEILLVPGNTPIARLTAEAKTETKKRIPGLHAGTTWLSDDFDERLPDSFWLGEE